MSQHRPPTPACAPAPHLYKARPSAQEAAHVCVKSSPLRHFTLYSRPQHTLCRSKATGQRSSRYTALHTNLVCSGPYILRPQSCATMSEDLAAQRTADGSVKDEDNRSAVGSSRSRSSMGKSGVSHKSGKSWRITPPTFDDVDRYAAGGKFKAGAEEDGGMDEQTLAERLRASAHVLGFLLFLLFIALLASSIQPLALWLSAIQVWSIFFAALKWESDQWLAKGGKYRGCRLLCQLCIIIIPGVIGSLLVFVASTFLPTQPFFFNCSFLCTRLVIYSTGASRGARQAGGL